MKTLKTAISIPENIYSRVEAAAKRLGMNRSQFYTTAVSEFLERHREEKITEKLNEIYAREDSQAEAMLSAMQISGLHREKW